MKDKPNVCGAFLFWIQVPEAGKLSKTKQNETKTRRRKMHTPPNVLICFQINLGRIMCLIQILYLSLVTSVMC